ncbi:PREDICTED: retinoblastoma-like protein 1 isoform X2 [Papilio xuthus]|uniref:Retinoblastoma-like protein 1 isoform X2 n=1 Tax=Papilio xuthus TaxID=66420 RepID=A0AAJ6Z1B1_PAPXU|nr:PREDICTED: retinoblastoma-like protein 1 isoform X2 [Papilio xuthus]
MSKPEESEENWISALDNLCSQLNVDPAAAEKSKKSFLEIKRNYTLDGDIQHWMACALYVACRTSITPTVQSGKVVEGNCVSLTRLLRLCNISLIQFFNKIKNWMEMALMSTDFKDRITRLEHKFAVSTVLFRKFLPIFQELFSGLTSEPTKCNTKSKKQKLQPCTTNALFEFSWCLYVCVKGEFHNSADDLVDMYHVLLSCLDFVFGNAFMSRRIDLINPAFKGLPPDWMKDDFELPKKPPCIISVLCEIKEGLAVEAATMKEYSWRPVIKSFFDKGILKGNSDQLTGLLDIGNFDANLKSLNNLYETYVLSVGEFDERIFLGEHANEQIGTKKVSGEEISQVIASFGPSGRACPDTPLTGRCYLAGREELTPVSEATNSLARLAAYLRNTKPFPSASLMRLFAECGVTEDVINAKVIKPCNGWAEQFSKSLRESKCSNEAITFRNNMVLCLYFKVFEHIIREEHRKKPQVSLQMLLSQETYQLTVFACCTEVVLHAYGVNSLRFPRVLQIYGLSAFHFYKIIELVVQALVDKLSRDVIKHLNAVEEEVLESLVWTSDSPLWDQLSKTPVPASTEVYVQESPLFRRNIGVIDRYLAPIADQAKKQLFKDNIKPGQSLLVQTNTTVKPDTVCPSPTSNGETTPNSTPKKAHNSLILFFRKFYSLAVVRMIDLCTRLRLTDEELKRKIWTCLEYSVMHQTQLMRDRHLDQILMCAVYVICKVSNNPNNQVERTFADIMKCYRQRPLADNHVYRSVLIKQSTGENSPERGDLINFYNKVYVQCMQSFALRFTGKHKDECGLSPLPAGRGDAACSPAGQRVSERHQLYVKPLTTPPHTDHHLTYRFSRSPAKDLHAINTLVSCEVGGVKRCAEGGDVIKRPRCAAPGVARKLQGLVSDRQAV